MTSGSVSAGNLLQEFYYAIRQKEWRDKFIGTDWSPRKHDPDGKKRQLLAMPAGSPRPKGKLGSALADYCCEASSCYDRKFFAKILKKQPHWFGESSHDVSRRRKAELLGLPPGSPKPKYNTALGKCLSSYISKGNESYDPKFVARITRLQPEWFESRGDRVKREILGLPTGCRRPPASTTLGAAIFRYTSKRSRWYDPKFDSRVRVKYPYWFRGNSLLKVHQNKIELLAMSPGSERPARGTRLDNALKHYLSVKCACYDERFASKIRKKHPKWFKRKKWYLR